MPERAYRTLGELRLEMRAMLGNASAGAAAGPNSVIIDTHLRNAQTLLYWTHDWAHLRRYSDETLGANQHLLDYPTDCNPDRVKAISVLRGTVWSPPLPKGITPQMYTSQDAYSDPRRWEPYLQIEFHPKSDQIYTIRVFFVRSMVRFTQDNDVATVDDNLISIVATATLKAHYRQPDAGLAKEASDALLMKLKAKSWGQDVFRPDDYIENEPLVRPQTV